MGHVLLFDYEAVIFRNALNYFFWINGAASILTEDAVSSL